ncbi:MAG: acetate--CoA ligase family protein [Burkholderiales bacterium]
MLEKLLSPRSIAIIGASHEERRPGGQPLHALTSYGYTGKVYAVNPRYTDIKGVPCFPTIEAVPEPVDLAIVALPASEVPRILEECGAARIRHALVLSAGFREIGEAGAVLQAQLDAALARSGVRIVGPNCIGMLNLGSRVFAGFGAGFRQPDWRRGPIAMISQSGGFAYSIMAFCQEAGIGMDYMVSTGNEADLGVLDFVEHFLGQDDVRLIAVYLEGLKDGRRLRALGRRALEVGKPIAVWKVGNTAVGQRAAVSHTANLTEEYDFYRDAFREGGFVEIREVYDLVDAAKVFRSGKRPRGRRAAIVTTSGGAGVLLADRCAESKVELPPLTAATVSALRPLLPGFASVGNPVDFTAALAQKEPEFTQATELIIADDNIDLGLVRSFPGHDVESWADHLIAQANACAKPILVSLSSTPAQAAAWAPKLDEAGVPCFEVPSRAVAAAAMLCDFAERERQSASAKPMRVVAAQDLSLDNTRGGLDEDESKRCLEAYGIRTPRRLFIDATEPYPERIDLEFPVAVKIVSPDIVHKTEAGVVRLRVTAVDLRRTLDEIRASASSYMPNARVRGFLLEEMAEGAEMIVGALSNPSFGPLVVVGMGGVHAEVLSDVARRYAPISAVQAREMIAELKGFRLLEGYRGQKPRDVSALADAVARLSWMITDHEGAISEIEINPLLVGFEGSGVTAVDAVVRLR